MESSKRPTPPGKLPVDVPKIYLNTTGKDQICLLPGDNRSEPPGPQYCSLPNLSASGDASAVPKAPLAMSCAAERQAATSADARAGSRHDCAAKSAQLSVYCSPRVSRKNARRFPGTITGAAAKLSPGDPDDVWNANYEKSRASRRVRLDSTSSAESDSSVRSASHVSTCATSDYTRFTSCDRLSMVPNVGEDEPVISPPGRTGKLRRIYSNPEPQFGVANFTSPESSAPSGRNLRDSKSCSDLESKLYTVNHAILEERLTQESGNLLSPPPLFPDKLLKTFSESKDLNKSYEQMYDELYKESFIMSAEDTPSSREVRIRQWLQEVHVSGPANH